MTYPHYGPTDIDQCIAAGVLPISINSEGRVVVLLGKEGICNSTRDTHTWSGFGGGRDPGERIELTAAREYEEESMALWCDRTEIMATIIYNLQDRVLTRFNNGRYLQYVIYFPYTDWPVKQFRRVFGHMERCARRVNRNAQEMALEKIDVDWFDLEELMESNSAGGETLRPCCLDNLTQIGPTYLKLMEGKYDF